jgi:hypothetical protein
MTTPHRNNPSTRRTPLHIRKHNQGSQQRITKGRLAINISLLAELAVFQRCRFKANSQLTCMIFWEAFISVTEPQSSTASRFHGCDKIF